MTLRRLSQVIAAVLAAFTVWTLTSMAGVTPASEFAPLLYGVLAASMGLAFVLIFFGLRLGTGGSAVYWQGDFRPRQLRGILLTLAAGIGVLSVAGLILDRSGRLDEVTASVAGLIVWTVVPAAFLVLGWVKWPRRLGSPPALTQLLAGVPAVGLAAVVASHSALVAGFDLTLPSPGLSLLVLAGVIVAAGAEEVICRVLLLTALLDRGASRFQAVFLSGVVFATAHAPLALAQPLFRADWPVLAYAAQTYAPMYLGQLLLGLLLGVVWLRTGSISLVTAIHTVCNLGSALALTLAV